MKVVHEFVDRTGKTNLDEFKLLAPLDMGDVPKTYHIVLNTAANASRLADLTKEHGFGDTDTVVITGCPTTSGSDSVVSSWDVARIRVRELCFENVPAIVGGLRRATGNDVATAGLVISFYGLLRVVQQAAESASGSSPIEVPIDSVSIARVSGHFLWRHLRWIAGMELSALLHLVGVFVDPTWLVEPDDPKSCRRFLRAFVGHRGRRGVAVAAHFMDVYRSAIDALSRGDLDDASFANDPSLFAVRYGARWACKHMNDGEPELIALSLGARHALAQLGRYIWLTWMSVIHPTEITLDRAKFFGDEEIAHFAYQQAL